MFVTLKWVKEEKELDVEDIEDLLSNLALVELYAQLEVVAALMREIEGWGPQISKEDLLRALGTFRNQIVEEVGKIAYTKTWILPLVGSLAHPKKKEGE